MGLNLHAIVRSAINTIHPDETITLLQSVGQVNSSGVIKPVYSLPQSVRAQVQTENDAALYYADRVGMNQQTVRAYIHSGETASLPSGIHRPGTRNGDLFQRDDGSWWLVTAVLENFKNVNWVCVRATLQENAPDMSASAESFGIFGFDDTETLSAFDTGVFASDDLPVIIV